MIVTICLVAESMSDGDTEALKLHVSVGDVTVEVEGTGEEVETWFEALRNDYLPPNSELPSKTSAQGGENETGSKQNVTEGKTLANFYNDAADPNKSETALLIGWYLAHENDESNFTPAEVQDAADTYQLSVGKNIPRDLKGHVSDGLLDPNAERNGNQAYKLTESGDEYVQNEILASHD